MSNNGARMTPVHPKWQQTKLVACPQHAKQKRLHLLQRKGTSDSRNNPLQRGQLYAARLYAEASAAIASNYTGDCE